jgi:hypothetical protein
VTELISYHPTQFIISQMYYNQIIRATMQKKEEYIKDEMFKVLEKELKERYVETIPETVRVILSEYLSKN